MPASKSPVLVHRATVAAVTPENAGLPHFTSFANPEGLIRWITNWKDGTARLRPDHKLAVVRELTNAQRIKL
ncbi:hypothetical protein, partial [Acetobacter estunensis]|uniref:hypothetical protein n=1 Tax=Acetobacter estunensis TaxID=104097 RepID=UPI001C2D8EEC